MSTIVKFLIWAIEGFTLLAIVILVAILVWWYKKTTPPAAGGDTHGKKSWVKLPGWTWAGVMLVMWMFSSVVLRTCSLVDQGRSET